MNIRFPRLATSFVIVAAVALSVSQAHAVFFPLGPSKDDYGLKYDVQLTDAGGDTVTVAFTLADEGRLKPVYSYTVTALRPTGGGSFAYDVKSKIALQPTADGKRAGQVRIRRDFVGKATIRVLTLSVDGKHQSAGAAYYDIPLNRFTIKAAAPTAAVQPAMKVIK